MPAARPSASPLDTASARSLSAPTPIVVVAKADGSVESRFSLVRYGGHYRDSAVDSFVVRTAEGKMRVRSDRELGLTEDSDRTAYLASDFDTDPSAA